MLQKIKNILGKFPLNRKLNEIRNTLRQHEAAMHDLKLLMGTSIAQNMQGMGVVEDMRKVEFKVFSQWGDDGIIQYLIQRIKPKERTFVEIGVEDYSEANTRFLLEHDNWSGLIIDSGEAFMRKVRESDWFWKYNLEARVAFVTTDNVNSLLESEKYKGPLGLLSLDVDGNDFWILKAIRAVDPAIIVVEYNWLFGDTRPISVPYSPNFIREQKHYSHLYFGASLPALHTLMTERGYALVACDSHGANAYFVKRDMLKRTGIKELKPKEAYVAASFRQSRDSNGLLDYLSKEKQLETIKGLPVINVVTGATEKI